MAPEPSHDPSSVPDPSRKVWEDAVSELKDEDSGLQGEGHHASRDGSRSSGHPPKKEKRRKRSKTRDGKKIHKIRDKVKSEKQARGGLAPSHAVRALKIAAL